MSNIYFTSDLHLGHKNIIQYCNRPFVSIDEMNKVLIDNWNSVVKSNDTVYQLGDFSFNKNPKTYLSQLNGNIIHIWGNHDRKRYLGELPKKLTLQHRNMDILLLHDPSFIFNPYDIDNVYLTEIASKCDYIFCGHVHEKWKYNKLGFTYIDGYLIQVYNVPVINVGVDVWDYKPVNIEELIKFKNE